MNFDTKIESYTFCDMPFLVKRDDLIDEKINGNKAYKFYFLFNADYNHIVSYGGNQSNAMLALAYITNFKNIRFTYFTPQLSNYLKNSINGNLKIALQNGANIKYAKNPNLESLNYAKQNNAFFVPQGGMFNKSQIGLEILARHILELELEDFCVFYSSGSGTSSLFLSKFLKPYNIDIWTTNCIGSKEYLIKQFLNLEKDSTKHPNIISTNKKFSFAKPYSEILEIYQKWLESGIEFDLLYDCIMWQAIANNLHLFKKYKNRLFIHSGGLSGNESQLERYKYKKLYNP